MSHEKEILDMQIYRLVKEFETLQYRKQNIKNLIPNTPIIYKKDLRNISLKGYYRKSTSGSTGEPLNIEKTIEQYIWAIATNFREFIWRK